MHGKIHWATTRNSSSNDNQDHAGLLYLEDGLIAVIADGVSGKRDSGKLAEAFVRLLIDKAAEHESVPGPHNFVAWVDEARLSLRECRFHLGAAVSYLIAAVPNGKLSYVIHAGDCRIGRQTAAGIEWLNTIHSLANAIGPLSEDELRCAPARNKLTRSFSCRWRSTPEILAWDLPLAGTLVLGTDGFWANIPAEQHAESTAPDWKYRGACSDDVSRLVLYERSGKPIASKPDGPNLYARCA